MRTYIAVSIVVLAIVIPHITHIGEGTPPLDLQRATEITGSLTLPVRPNTPVSGEEPYLQRGGSRDIMTPIIGIAIGSLLVVISILYRYAYKRSHVEKNKREGLHGRVGEG